MSAGVDKITPIFSNVHFADELVTFFDAWPIPEISKFRIKLNKPYDHVLENRHLYVGFHSIFTLERYVQYLAELEPEDRFRDPVEEEIKDAILIDRISI